MILWKKERNFELGKVFSGFLEGLVLVWSTWLCSFGALFSLKLVGY